MGSCAPAERPAGARRFESQAGACISTMNRNLLPAWATLLLLTLSVAPGLAAAENESPPNPATPSISASGTNLSLSVAATARRARWQQHLTLGPGDALNLSLFGMPETERLEVVIGPDGRITFLQARDMMATGLT